MPKRSRSKDVNKAAHQTLGALLKNIEGKDPAAVSLGRKGGLKGGKARAANMTPEQRSESARKAVQARWAKNKAV